MDRVMEVLVDQWLFDIWVLSQWWMWAPLGIPGIVYALFMLLKWGALMTPISAPFNSILSGVFRAGYRGWKQTVKES